MGGWGVRAGGKGRRYLSGGGGAGKSWSKRREGMVSCMKNMWQMLQELVLAELGEKKTNVFTTDSLPVENEFSLAELLKPRESQLSFFLVRRAT